MIRIVGLILLVSAPFDVTAASWKKYLGYSGDFDQAPDSWTGRWFPDKPTPAPPHSNDQEMFSENNMHNAKSSKTAEQQHGKWKPDKPLGNGLGYQVNPSSDSESPDYLVDDWRSLSPLMKTSNHVLEMITMNNKFCDDGKTNLTLDLPNDESHFICSSPRRYIEPSFELPPVLTKYAIPPAFVPSHRCMNETITYVAPLPTFGPHRPVWAKWGEYHYLPPQRWIHNLEHGGIVMLYHPCAHHFFVYQLKNLVRKCLYKHVITPYKLSEDRPLALVAWGWSLTMAEVDLEAAKNFIQDHANRAPEMIDGDGKYDLYLKHPSSEFSELGEGICSKA